MSALEELFGARLAVVVPDVVGAAVAAEIRGRLEVAGWHRYRLIDRGRYDVIAAVDEPALAGALVALAAERVGRRLALVEVRALRLGAGDYLLAHHDRIHDDRQVELVLDLSPVAVPGAEVHYRRGGQVYARIAAAPGALSIVERDAAVTCNHTYVSQRHAAASVVRLVLRLR